MRLTFALLAPLGISFALTSFAVRARALDTLPAGAHTAPLRGPTFKRSRPLAAPSYTLHVVHAFSGTDGLTPLGNLTADAAGNMYGTTAMGFQRQGTLFKLSKSGKLTTIYNFNTNLTEPGANVVMDEKGNFYGTTMTGESSSTGGPDSNGGIFKVTPKGVESVLYAFLGGSDGDLPFSNLLYDGQGNLYGTASLGGIFTGQCRYSGCGVVFKITTGGAYSVIHAFNGKEAVNRTRA